MAWVKRHDILHAFLSYFISYLKKKLDHLLYIILHIAYNTLRFYSFYLLVKFYITFNSVYSKYSIILPTCLTWFLFWFFIQAIGAILRSSVHLPLVCCFCLLFYYIIIFNSFFLYISTEVNATWIYVVIMNLTFESSTLSYE